MCQHHWNIWEKTLSQSLLSILVGPSWQSPWQGESDLLGRHTWLSVECTRLQAEPKGSLGEMLIISQQAIQANWPTEGGKSQALGQETTQEGLKLWRGKHSPCGKKGSRLPSEHQWRIDTGKASTSRMGGFMTPTEWELVVMVL